MAGPHPQFIATVITKKEAVGRQQKTMITYTEWSSNTPLAQCCEHQNLLKIIFLKVRIKLKFTVAFTAAICVHQSHYGTQLIHSSGGQERPQRQLTLCITPCLQHWDCPLPGICTSALINFRCPYLLLPGLVGSAPDPNKRGLTHFGSSPRLLPVFCTSSMLMAPRSPCPYHGVSSLALSLSPTCNARVRHLFL